MEREKCEQETLPNQAWTNGNRLAHLRFTWTEQMTSPNGPSRTRQRRFLLRDVRRALPQRSAARGCAVSACWPLSVSRGCTAAALFVFPYSLILIFSHVQTKSEDRVVWGSQANDSLIFRCLVVFLVFLKI
jgi:hypothetical protein